MMEREIGYYLIYDKTCSFVSFTRCSMAYIIHFMYESYFVSHFIWPICYALCKWTIIYSFSTFNDVCIFIVGFFLDKVIYRLGNKWPSLDPKWLSESPCWVTCEAPARVALGITTYLSIKTMVKSYILNLHLTLIRKFSMIICIFIGKWFDFKITLSKAFTFQSGMPRVSYVKGKRFHWEGFAIWFWLVDGTYEGKART